MPEQKDLTDYVTREDQTPFADWFDGITDSKAQARIMARLARLRLGLYGDVKPVKGSGGLSELRIDTGPGYRVYFREYGKNQILLLCGGTKRTQNRDIEQAKSYWQEFKERNP
jgi:putative addiction module killer protein